MGVEGQFHVGSYEDEPGPTRKVIKHLTSTSLLKTLDHESSNLAQKSILRESELLIITFNFYQHVLDTKKKNSKTAVTMQTFQLLIMTTKWYRQCRDLKMLSNKFTITKLGVGHYLLHNVCF